MARIVEIRDLDAPELDVYARLTENQLRSRRDGAKGLFIAESEKVIGYALDAGCVPASLLMDRKHLRSAASLLDRCGDVPIFTAPEEVLASLTGYALTRGMLCAMARPAPADPESVLRGVTRAAVLEGITDTTNLGAIFRSAAALGCGAVVLSPTCADPLTRRACRVSMGTVFQVPWCRIGESAADWPEKGLCFLRSLGFRTAALALREDAVSLRDPRLRQEEKLCLLLGTEGDGLQPETIQACDWCVRIPMSNGVDSLNVAAAAAVAFWQLCSE